MRRHLIATPLIAALLTTPAASKPRVCMVKSDMGLTIALIVAAGAAYIIGKRVVRRTNEAAAKLKELEEAAKRCGYEPANR